jgi:septum formation protein
MEDGMQLILASASKARAELLRAAGYDFRQIPAAITEAQPERGENPSTLTVRLARHKAAAVARAHPTAFVIGADTVVAMGTRIIGKAASSEEAVRILQQLSGKTHQLITGVCVFRPAGASALPPLLAGVDTARVTIRRWTEARIRRHVELIQPLACAGAYAIQDGGAAIIERVEGDPTTVVGLPMGMVERFLGDLGYIIHV